MKQACARQVPIGWTRIIAGARLSSGASFHALLDREPPARILIMSEPEARGPEDHDAPLEWRAPSNDMIPNDRYVL